jgi:hypothetical protein
MSMQLCPLDPADALVDSARASCGKAGSRFRNEAARLGRCLNPGLIDWASPKPDAWRRATAATSNPFHYVDAGPTPFKGHLRSG